MEILKRMFISILVVTFALSAAPLAALADQGVPVEPVKVNKDLTDKVNQLENRIKQLEMKPSGEVKAVPAYTPAPQGGALRAMEDINVSGYVETSYSQNTHRPSTGSLFRNNEFNYNNRAGVDDLRSFDRNNNSFVMNTIKLTLEKTPAETGGVGFRTDLMMGEDAKWLNARTKNSQASGIPIVQDPNSGLLSAQNEYSNLYIENAYINLRAPYGNGIDLYFGRMTSLMGFEVIETKDNWNTSRGLLFNWAYPAYAETGARATYQWNEKFKTAVGVGNGGNQDIDVNSGKSIEAKADYKFNDKLSVSQGIYAGQDTPSDYGFGSGHHGQYNLVLDTIVKLNVTDKWSMAGETMWGNAWAGQYYGFAVYNKYEYNSWISFNNRFEYLSDSSNAKMGPTNMQSGNAWGWGINGDGDGYDVWEVTNGVDFKIYKNLLARGEYRMDMTEQNNRFRGDDGEFQSTFLGSLILSF